MTEIRAFSTTFECYVCGWRGKKRNYGNANGIEEGRGGGGGERERERERGREEGGKQLSEREFALRMRTFVLSSL